MTMIQEHAYLIFLLLIVKPDNQKLLLHLVTILRPPTFRAPRYQNIFLRVLTEQPTFTVCHDIVLFAGKHVCSKHLPSFQAGATIWE